MGADRLLLVVCVLLLVYLTVVPLVMLVLGSLSSTGRVLEGELTLRHFERVVRDREALGLLLTSVLYAMGTTALAFAIGTAVAWAVERTDVPLRSLWWALALVPLIVPGIVHSIAWIFLLSPEIGWLKCTTARAGRPLAVDLHIAGHGLGRGSPQRAPGLRADGNSLPIDGPQPGGGRRSLWSEDLADAAQDHAAGAAAGRRIGAAHPVRAGP